jgi:hypothetical protein
MKTYLKFDAQISFVLRLKAEIFFYPWRRQIMLKRGSGEVRLNFVIHPLVICDATCQMHCNVN